MQVRSGIRWVAAVALVAGVSAAVGCAKKAASSAEAIQHAQVLSTPQQKADYLVGQARAFLNSKEYQEAIKTAQHVLASIDANSQAARDLLEKAKAQLAGKAKAAAGDAKKALGL